MARKCDLVSDCQASLNISESAGLLGFFHTAVSKVCKEQSRKKNPLTSSSLDENPFFLSEVAGEL